MFYSEKLKLTNSHAEDNSAQEGPQLSKRFKGKNESNHASEKKHSAGERVSKQDKLCERKRKTDREAVGGLGLGVRQVHFMLCGGCSFFLCLITQAHTHTATNYTLLVNSKDHRTQNLQQKPILLSAHSY